MFEIREAGGPATDMLIRTPELGAALAHALGTAPVALMRGHGDVVVAPPSRKLSSARSIPRSMPGSKPRRCSSGRARLSF